MSEELLYEKGDVLVRISILEPGESSTWHTDESQISNPKWLS